MQTAAAPELDRLEVAVKSNAPDSGLIFVTTLGSIGKKDAEALRGQLALGATPELTQALNTMIALDDEAIAAAEGARAAWESKDAAAWEENYNKLTDPAANERYDGAADSNGLNVCGSDAFAGTKYAS